MSVTVTIRIATGTDITHQAGFEIVDVHAVSSGSRVLFEQMKARVRVIHPLMNW